MMTRRSFLRRLAVGAAMLQLRFMPASAKELPAAAAANDDTGRATVMNAHDDCYRSAKRGLYMHKGQLLTAEQVLAQLPRRKERIYLA